MESDAIPETALVGLIDRLNRTTRGNWAAKGLLRKAPRREGYREEDAAQLAAFVQLVRSDVGDFHEIAAAWDDGIKDELNAAIAADPDECDIKLIALIDGDTKEGMLITHEDDFASLLIESRRRRVVRVVDLSTEVRSAREAFRRILKARNRR
jgi:hypothetical protein